MDPGTQEAPGNRAAGWLPMYFISRGRVGAQGKGSSCLSSGCHVSVGHATPRPVGVTGRVKE